MFTDTIVAALTTITGSVGVIGGWVYNKGIKENLGMSNDFVEAGGHADPGFGFTLPFIGMGLPGRNLSGAIKDGVNDSIYVQGFCPAEEPAGR